MFSVLLIMFLVPKGPIHVLERSYSHTHNKFFPVLEPLYSCTIINLHSTIFHPLIYESKHCVIRHEIDKCIKANFNSGDNERNPKKM